jgi:hypothetical protein
MGREKVEGRLMLLAADFHAFQGQGVKLGNV